MRQSWGRDFLCYELITSEVQAGKSARVLAAMCSESLEPHWEGGSLYPERLELTSGAVPKDGLCSISPFRLSLCREIKSWAWLPAHRQIKELLPLVLCIFSFGRFSDTPRGLFRIMLEGKILAPLWVEVQADKLWLVVLAGHGAVWKAWVWGHSSTCG